MIVNLSVVVITFNEEKNIERCLNSIKNIADEIIIIDSYSTDKTLELVESFNTRIIQKSFAGYGEQKRFAVEQAANNTILALDADEELSKELFNQIQSVKKSWVGPYYIFNRLNYYCGKPIKHCGWYPDKQIRLFDRNLTNWNDKGVHESVNIIDGFKPINLMGNLNHYTCDTIEEHRAKEEKYAKMNAQILINHGKKVYICTPFLKYLFRFIKVYLFKLGFLDGYYGWIISKTVAKSSYLKYRLAYRASLS